MKQLIIILSVFLSFKGLSQNNNNPFIGNWEILEIKAIIGPTEILIHKKDSMDLIAKNLIQQSGRNSKSDSVKIYKDLQKQYNQLDTTIYTFNSDTTYFTNTEKNSYKIELKKQWIMLNPKEFEKHWQEYKVINEDTIKVKLGIMGGYKITTYGKK